LVVGAVVVPVEVVMVLVAEVVAEVLQRIKIIFL
jgi:hypothetical protein